MTDRPTRFKGSWKYKDILDGQTKALEEKFKDHSREQILAKLIEVMAAVEGIRYTLTSLDSRGIGNGYSRGCVYATSDFFPEYLGGENDEDDGKVYVTKWKEDENGRKDCYFEGEEPAWDGKQKFIHRDSLSIPCTTYVGDEVEILAAHEQAMAAYVCGGTITFGDVRILQAVLSSHDPVLIDTLDKGGESQ